jgi:2'-deoxynucleoside 5'-phosphate N-hydrolase
MDKKFKKIYIAGALTNVGEKPREIYRKIGEICKGFSREVFNPHVDGMCPVKNPEVSPEEVWQKEEGHVASSDITIAYVGVPSLGTGGEIEIARVNDKKIILWWLEGEKVSRFALGNPAVKFKIEAKNKEDLYKHIKAVLEKI